MRETKEALENVSVSLEVLQEATGKLNFNLSLVRTSINRTLMDPGCHDEDSDATTAQLCRNIRQSLSQLQISANFTRVLKLNTELKQITVCVDQRLIVCLHISAAQSERSAGEDEPCIENRPERHCPEGEKLLHTTLSGLYVDVFQGVVLKKADFFYPIASFYVITLGLFSSLRVFPL